ncbi:MAG: VWA domain-containing protein [Desulfobacteraceae bacterium]|nr:VWA domain-containing protein [Desulfobacteraceae bacterium]
MKPAGKAFFAMAMVVCFGLSLVITRAEAGQSKVGCRVETDRGVLAAGGPQNVVIKVSLDAPLAPSSMERPRVNLALVLDRSGSMTGDKIERAREAAIEALKRLGPGDIFSLVVYDDTIDTVVPAQGVENIEGIIRKIRQIVPGGSTALFGGVSQGAAEIRKNLGGDYVHRIVLLSDGLANVGPRTPEDLGRLGAALIKEKISVTTVGVGTDYNEDLMARLSQKSDGNIYFVESGDDLPMIFAAELGDVLNVVAKEVRLFIEMPKVIKPLGIVGRQGRIRGGRVELFMNQLYGGQEKYALVEVAIPASKSGGTMEIATARVVYDNPFTKRRETATARSVARFSDNPAEVERSANVDVIREYQLNLNALSQEKAIVLSDSGRKKAAVDELKKSANKLKKVGTMYRDSVLLEQAEELEIQAETIRQEGMSKKSRKVLRTKSYQMKNQQKSK